ncbi:MAG: glutaredoxin family protein [Synechococcaceae cyanobacterium]
MSTPEQALAEGQAFAKRQAFAEGQGFAEAPGFAQEQAVADLVLFTRQGCCLCEGLEERLRGLDPPPRLTLVDVDTDPELQARFGLVVPLLADADDQGTPRLLPRVPPRLGGEALASWLRRQRAAAAAAAAALVPAPAPAPAPATPVAAAYRPPGDHA